MAPLLRAAGALISVKDLGRSTTFYGDVLGFEVQTRDDDVVVLGDENLQFLTLRRAPAGALPRGPDTLGLRALFWEVASRAELDRVDAQLRAHMAFTSRSTRPDGGETLTGLDPDHIALAFADEVPGKPFGPSGVPSAFYSVDV